MKRTPQEALEYLNGVARAIANPVFSLASLNILNTEEFKSCWGGEKHHHMYDGGLLVHTAEVMDTVLQNGGDNNTITATIFHDVMKVKDYKRMGHGMVSAPYKKLIHHVQGSAIEFNILVALLKQNGYKINQVDVEEVTHCILSHHGRKDWGSIIEPQTKGAMLLHYADMMSMIFGEGR